LTEDALKEYAILALSFLIDNREALIEDGRLIRQALSDHTEIDAELCEVETEISVVAQMIEKTISDNAQAPLDQDEYAKSYSGPHQTLPGLTEALYDSHAAARGETVQGRCA